MMICTHVSAHRYQTRITVGISTQELQRICVTKEISLLLSAAANREMYLEQMEKKCQWKESGKDF